MVNRAVALIIRKTCQLWWFNWLDYRTEILLLVAPHSCSKVTFSLSHDVIFLMVSPLLGRFLVSFNLQSAICGLQSAVCGLRSAVCGLRSAVCSLQSANVIHVTVIVAGRMEILNWTVESRAKPDFLSPAKHCNFTLESNLLSGLKNQDYTVRGMRTPSPENGKRDLSLSLLLLFLFQQESAAALRLFELGSSYDSVNKSTYWNHRGVT